MPIRPAVTDSAAHDALYELGQFRHVYRQGCGVDLGRRRPRLVLDKTLAGKRKAQRRTRLRWDL